MLKKYKYNFITFFKSCITDKFFGTKEIIKTCLECNKPRYYIESFYYLKFDANEVNKYFSNSNNFILDALKKESENYVEIELYCPFCKTINVHKVNKKIMAISFNLIISLDRQEINVNNQNLKYPLTLNLDNFGVGIYNLKGVIKESIVGGKKYFICIYKVMNLWFISDGINIEHLNYHSPLNHNIGNVVMLFYNNENQ
jgi:ubiquitin C-terminal hydrolase